MGKRSVAERNDDNESQGAVTMIKVGIIGFGKMGQIRARAIESCGGAEVDTVFDPNAEVRDFHTVTDSIQILAEPRIDAVFICTPNYLNKSLTIEALRAGKHVFCEKPPALNAAEVAEVQSVEAKSKKVLMYGFNHRHHDSIKAMKAYIDSAEFGRVLWMRGRYGKSVDSSFGGGILIDQGIHMLDIFVHFCGSFDQVHAVISNLYWNLDIEDNVFATFRNSKTGVVASLHSTMTQWRHLFSLEVFLEQGYLVLTGPAAGAHGEASRSGVRN